MLGDPPEIDEGSFVSRPSTLTDGNKKVKIGSPAYVRNGFDVIIDCKFLGGIRPITIQWFRNGSPDPQRGNTSTITIGNPRNGDVFICRADNLIGFDAENTTIYIVGGKWIMHICVYVYIRLIHRFTLHIRT